MILWRISAFADLTGRGGLLVGGRWHNAGRSVVYLADSPASAMLEVLVHLEVDAEDLPDNLRLIRVTIPEDVEPVSIAGLRKGWEDDEKRTREMGDAWLDANQALLLAVPSAIMPHTTNYLLNPLHPSASDVALAVESLRLDRRLLKGGDNQ